MGGGRGSIAIWLSERVGPAGRVLVTDIDTRFLESIKRRNLEVRRHDIASDPLPEAAFDLVHARLVLLHMRQRGEALKRMVKALKAGGWLVDEEFDARSMPPDLTVSPAEINLRTYMAMGRLLEERGVDTQFGRKLFSELHACGLADVSAEARAFMWEGRSVGANLWQASFEHLRRDLINGGYVTEEVLEQDLAHLGKTDFLAPSPIMWAAWGRRPLT